MGWSASGTGSRNHHEAAWWIRKAASDQYAEHLGRLREGIAELAARRVAEWVAE